MADAILSSTPEVISRQDAIRLGLDRYFTGLPCAHGHISCRYCISRACVSCGREYSRRSTAKHPDRHTKYARENKDKIRIKNAKWRLDHPNYTQASASWRLEHKERVAELIREWGKRHKDRLHAYKQNRRARKKANGGRLSSDIVKKLLILQRGKCACCGAPLGKNFHLDHIVPLALGGSNTDNNMQLLKQKCNLRKDAKNPIDFMQGKGFLL